MGFVVDKAAVEKFFSPQIISCNYHSSNDTCLFVHLSPMIHNLSLYTTPLNNKLKTSEDPAPGLKVAKSCYPSSRLMCVLVVSSVTTEIGFSPSERPKTEYALS
jgi:hypothetical protein